jgi:TolB-like protein
VAVLPFQNMSGDPEQEYFADGLTEDIITELSRWRWLLVISRNSTFTYKGRAVDVKQAARDLGVRYVLEGSVRKAGGRVRLTAQLIDGQGDKHIWAERYDRELSDVFAMQDEVTSSIVAAIDPSIRIHEMQEVLRKQETHLGAWDHFLRGMAHANRFTAEDNRRARAEFQTALALDPGYGAAMAMLGRTHSHDLWYGWTSDRAASLAAAQEHGRRAVALDSREPMAHLVLANHALLEGRHADAMLHVSRAVELNPNYHQAQFICGMIHASAGDPETALRHIAIAMRLSPHDPMAFAMHHNIGLAHYLRGEDDQAVASLRTALSLNAGHSRSSVLLAATLARLRRMDEARDALVALKDPEAVLVSLPLREPDKARVRADLALIAEPRKAGAAPPTRD